MFCEYYPRVFFHDVTYKFLTIIIWAKEPYAESDWYILIDHFEVKTLLLKNDRKIFVTNFLKANPEASKTFSSLIVDWH